MTQLPRSAEMVDRAHDYWALGSLLLGLHGRMALGKAAEHAAHAERMGDTELHRVWQQTMTYISQLKPSSARAARTPLPEAQAYEI